MSRSWGLLLLAVGVGGCSWGRLRAGATAEGEVVLVSTIEPGEARRQALEAELPLFFSTAARQESASLLEEEVFARPKRFIGRERLRSGRVPLVEVRLDALAADLERKGLLRPLGFAGGSDKVLLALSESDGGYGIGTTADAMRRALMSRGIAAADARDPLNPVPFRAATAEEAVAAAAAGGVDWIVVGRAEASVEPDVPSGAWRAAARLQAGLYSTRGSTLPFAIDAQASVVDVSSAAARGQALDQSGAEAAVSVAARLEKGRSGRSESIVLSLPPRDAARIRALVAALRAIEGVESASLGAWRGPEEAALVRVFAEGLGVDELAARLLRQDPSLRLVGVEPESRRVTIEAAMEWGD